MAYMPNAPGAQVAIVDYGLGNLFSVKQACEHAGLRAIITSSRQEITAADAVVLPGVGAFGDAVETLARLDLMSVLRDIAASPKPLVGICLGMQLLMTESHEFGSHRGLGIIEGEVVRLEMTVDGPRMLKVPQVGWNHIYAAGLGRHRDGPEPNDTTWKSPLLEGIADGEYLYFVHSFYPKPVDAGVVVSITRYGPIEFCSSLRLGSVFACQFHPERSGPAGLCIYRNLAKLITAPKPEQIDV
jgi:glutamine amidotransferase